jgi:uncharacterized membrane protein
MRAVAGTNARRPAFAMHAHAEEPRDDQADAAMKAWAVWAVLLGVALGGFFDGILLHQILQWHHLLSLVQGVGDLRAQVLWDGWFHALMYGLAGLALWGLWRAWRRGRMAFGRPLMAALLAGFGLWHVADSVLSHWLLGIHRIRVDVDNPLLWDLLWFAVFGLLPLGLAFLLRRGPPGQPGRVAAAGLASLTLATAAAGWWAMQAPAGAESFVTVVFRPDYGPRDIAAAIAATDARLVRGDSKHGVVVVAPGEGGAWRFYLHGALLVSGAGTPAGCFAWTSS